MKREKKNIHVSADQKLEKRIRYNMKDQRNTLILLKVIQKPIKFLVAYNDEKNNNKNVL